MWARRTEKRTSAMSAMLITVIAVSRRSIN
jgi:hypothetical protein